jgi:1-aminocyclopropane-1-carboxylate deaminase/D-cysteine desulfhydrase-like pyridoxal-dependent ACC family enzyme
MPEAELIGVTVSRSVADQKPKVVTLQQAVAEQLDFRRRPIFFSGMTTLPGLWHAK